MFEWPLRVGLERWTPLGGLVLGPLQCFVAPLCLVV